MSRPAVVAEKPLPPGPDFAAIASKGALNGTSGHTRLSVGKDGVLQYVDLERGNLPEDAMVVGLRTIHGAVKTDKERSLVRRELLRQLAALKAGNVKQAAFPTMGRLAYALKQTLRQHNLARNFKHQTVHDLDYTKSFVENVKEVLRRADEAKRIKAERLAGGVVS